MSYVYIKSEPGLWTVGFYKPDGTWETESDHGSSDEMEHRRYGVGVSIVRVITAMDHGALALALVSVEIERFLEKRDALEPTRDRRQTDNADAAFASDAEVGRRQRQLTATDGRADVEVFRILP